MKFGYGSTAACLTLACVCAFGAEEEYRFDMASYKKSPFEFGGYAELRYEHWRLDPHALLYALNYLDKKSYTQIDRFAAALQLEGRLRLNEVTFHARFNPDYINDPITENFQTTTHEANLSWRASPSFTLDAGKKLAKWGKGYAWNPAGFIERPKDPNDPDLTREGYTLLSADMIFSFDGALQTVAFTPVVFPVYKDLNDSFGETGYTDVAGKIYLLLMNTDIDVMAMSEGSRSARSGMDFSKNISTHFEIHGEWAYVTDAQKVILDVQNNRVTENHPAHSALLGLRYLTRWDTTLILEYYRNGAGFTKEEMRRFFALIEDAVLEPDNTAQLSKARSLSKDGYTAQSAMLDYLYGRISQKDPFDWLYVTPSVTVVWNTTDRSTNLSPEVVYTGVTDFEIRLKSYFVLGDAYTEFGEKPNASRWELRLRYFF